MKRPTVFLAIILLMTALLTTSALAANPATDVNQVAIEAERIGISDMQDFGDAVGIQIDIVIAADLKNADQFSNSYSQDVEKTSLMTCASENLMISVYTGDAVGISSMDFSSCFSSCFSSDMADFSKAAAKLYDATTGVEKKKDALRSAKMKVMTT